MLPEHEVAQPSPVHAGIDPSKQFPHIAELWFPHTRGDRPGELVAASIEDMVPPHARG